MLRNEVSALSLEKLNRSFLRQDDKNIMRIDLFISEKFSFTRNKSQAFITDGLVSVNGKTITKPSFEVVWSENIELREERKVHWVSRSAGKLDGFLESLSRHSEWNEESIFPNPRFFVSQDDDQVRIQWATCLDVGSSTGWFTQVLLDRWASHVDAVDVGTDQLHQSLRNDPRVTSYEQTDIRDFQDLLSQGAQREYGIIVCDASFISLEEIFPSILKLANKNTHILLLWKPQFEVGREHLRKTWVPKDEKIVAKRQKEWEDFLRSHNCEILQKEKSTVIGEAGNEEWMYFIRKI